MVCAVCLSIFLSINATRTWYLTELHTWVLQFMLWCIIGSTVNKKSLYTSLKTADMISTHIITWWLCFFPGFDRFIPGFDRFIPGFDSFIPASIPVTGTLPLQSIYTLVNKMCIVLYFEIILFHFIWNKYFYLKKLSILRTNIFLKSKVDTNPMLPPSHFNATGCRLWSTGSDRSQSSVVNKMQKGASEIAVVQISRTEYIMKCYHNMVDQIPQKRNITALKPMKIPLFTSATRHLQFAHERRVTSSRSTRGNSLKQKLNLHQVGDPIKRHTDLFKYGYIPYV